MCLVWEALNRALKNSRKIPRILCFALMLSVGLAYFIEFLSWIGMLDFWQLQFWELFVYTEFDFQIVIIKEYLLFLLRLIISLIQLIVLFQSRFNRLHHFNRLNIQLCNPLRFMVWLLAQIFALLSQNAFLVLFFLPNTLQLLHLFDKFQFLQKSLLFLLKHNLRLIKLVLLVNKKNVILPVFF